MAKITFDIEIDFTPSAAFDIPWNDVEMKPIKREDGPEGKILTACEENEEEADFWSVYLRGVDGEARCIADLPTKKLATQFAKLIKYASNSKFKK